MITKWICIPYGIIVIIMAGYVLSVVPEYLSSYSMWYSSYDHYSLLENSLIMGVFFGIITGFLVDKFSQRVSFALAAVLALTSYCLIPEFDGSTRNKLEDWQFYVLLGLVFIAGQSSSLAIISTIKVNLMNFSISASPIILSILLSYLYIYEHIESTIHWSFFFGVDNRIYMIGTGITVTIVYAIAAVILQVDEGEHARGGVGEYQLATLDKVGLSVFVIFEIFMVLLLLLFRLVIKDVTISTWICIILLAGNFLIPMISSEFILNRASDLLSDSSPSINDLTKLQKGRDKDLLASLKSWKLLFLLASSIIMIGSGSLVYERLTKISIAISMSFLAEYAMVWFIFGNFVTRLLVGMIFILMNFINDYIYMVIFAVEVLFALVLVIFTPDESVIVFNVA